MNNRKWEDISGGDKPVAQGPTSMTKEALRYGFKSFTNRQEFLSWQRNPETKKATIISVTPAFDKGYIKGVVVVYTWIEEEETRDG
ncbi:MAG: hypothetical protein KAI07_00650 [Deltaproteobacteria bacterium]|nr:hypothetical protein [Deltaproteobacteria bacterium]